MIFLAEEPVLAGSDDKLVFKLWEGDIPEPITDNMYIGTFPINGEHLDSGSRILSGAELILDYEFLDSGQINLEVTIPSVGASFKGPQNFYSRQDGQINFEDAQQRVLEEQRNLEQRIASLEEKVSDRRLDQAKDRLESVSTRSLAEADAETTKQRLESLREAKKLLSAVREENRIEILEMELQAAVDCFDRQGREYASTSEEAEFDNLTRTAARKISDNPVEAKNNVDKLWSLIYGLLWRQDWYVQDFFERQCSQPWAYRNKSSFDELVSEGHVALSQGNMSRLRGVVYEIQKLRFPVAESRETGTVSNVIHRQ